MQVFYFTTASHGLENIRKRRLKIARISGLNDPFEFLSPEQSDRAKRAQLRASKKELDSRYGLLCFSRSWHNPVLWGHYAEKHGGVCLGFDLPSDDLKQVRYVTARGSWPAKVDEAFAQDLLVTKFVHWSYEEEYRACCPLELREGGLYFTNFSPSMRLTHVIVGQSSKITRREVAEALGELKDSVTVFKSRSAFRTFRIVRNRRDDMWE